MKRILIPMIAAASIVSGSAAAQDASDPFVAAVEVCRLTVQPNSIVHLHACLHDRGVTGDEARYPDLGVRMMMVIRGIAVLQVTSTITQGKAVNIYNRHIQSFLKDWSARANPVTQQPRHRPEANQPRRRPT
jgi:hypothetical protein